MSRKFIYDILSGIWFWYVIYSYKLIGLSVNIQMISASDSSYEPSSQDKPDTLHNYISHSFKAKLGIISFIMVLKYVDINYCLKNINIVWYFFNDIV